MRRPRTRACSARSARSSRSSRLAAAAPGAPAAQGIHKIKHVVIIMQENRSFDSYFGTYPGADGIPGLAGNPGRVPCVPDPLRHRCVRPYHDRHDVNDGGPHDARRVHDRLRQRAHGRVHPGARELHERARPAATASPTLSVDMMGYHDQREIPNYWTYARDFVLQDHMFEPVASWSLPAHLYLVSEWSALCVVAGRPVQLQEQHRGSGAARPTSGRRTRIRPTTPGPTSRTSSTDTT